MFPAIWCALAFEFQSPHTVDIGVWVHYMPTFCYHSVFTAASMALSVVITTEVVSLAKEEIRESK